MKFLKNIINNQYEYFNNGYTKSIYKRISDLIKLRDYLKSNEDLFADSLQSDLGLDAFQSYTAEISVVYEELKIAIKHTEKWAKTRRVSSNISNFPVKSYIKPCPRGVVLIISPWNYPLQLALVPLISAVASGNTVVLKPSQHAPKTAFIIKNLLEKVFDNGHVNCILGDDDISRELLDCNFNHIFFTGSTRVGKQIAKKAAETLTPITLELGGKSPCIVDETADINICARRIIWGKCINSGQTCVAPDYILVKPQVKDRLILALQHQIKAMYGENPLLSPDYSRIINKEHYNRIRGLILDGTIIFGGDFDDNALKISPTLISADLSDDVMQSEIFGPILPILEYNSLSDIKAIISQNPNPLALYIFSKRKSFCDNIINSISFGGGCINDTIMHITNTKLPFGGILQSGVGVYHGKYGFDTFTHYKSIMKKSKFELKLKYPPYRNKLKIIKKIR